MWKCLDCKYLHHKPFRYYGGATGFDPERLACIKGYFCLDSIELSGLKAVNIVGDACQDFEKLEKEKEDGNL